MTDAHARTLAALLDHVIPPSADGRLPGAGVLGMAEHVIAAMQRAPEMELAVVPALEAAEAAARERHGRGFAELSPEQQHALLDGLVAAHPALMPTLAFHTYVAYYQHPRVLAALGFEPRPPHPRGYEMAPNDLELLAPVRARGPRYREV
ncbi:MAG TPA: gluconate 2-dehydrogenase subunit 3 family protein [Candidatus Limnocylindria bacterium]|nr:gluconate 2-dehydrogenase subunit 3 family protein [Candidatus Limnocylindria bacterium]